MVLAKRNVFKNNLSKANWEEKGQWAIRDSYLNVIDEQEIDKSEETSSSMILLSYVKFEMVVMTLIVVQLIMEVMIVEMTNQVKWMLIEICKRT